MRGATRAMQAAWDGIRFELDAKLATFASNHVRMCGKMLMCKGVDLETEFLLLLATGKAR